VDYSAVSGWDLAAPVFLLASINLSAKKGNSGNFAYTFSEVRLQLARKIRKRVKKDALTLNFHREFIAHCYKGA
jgi:hypothetical protein